MADRLGNGAENSTDLASGVIDVAGLQGLIQTLTRRGYVVVGPRPRDGVIGYDVIHSVGDLPKGVGDEQAPGRYRTVARGDEAFFGYAHAAQSWKRQLFPPRQLLWRHTAEVTTSAEDAGAPPRYALVGVRACELAALTRLDEVLLARAYTDHDYAARRAEAFIVAVSCSSPAGTCFCVSPGTGPRPGAGYDLLLTELLDGEHRFLVEAATERAAGVLAEVPLRPADGADLAAAARVTETARSSMGRQVELDGVRDLLYAEVENPRWEDVAERCLSCGNCTMVCPTCFCTGVEDTSDLLGQSAERWRVWDSCFTADFSYLHGGSVRASVRSRYRQWLTHKFAAWQDQFGSLGCVGCGRCVTWCPVGIDVTEELAALRAGARGVTAGAR